MGTKLPRVIWLEQPKHNTKEHSSVTSGNQFGKSGRSAGNSGLGGLFVGFKGAAGVQKSPGCGLCKPECNIGKHEGTHKKRGKREF